MLNAFDMSCVTYVYIPSKTITLFCNRNRSTYLVIQQSV